MSAAADDNINSTVAGNDAASLGESDSAGTGSLHNSRPRPPSLDQTLARNETKAVSCLRLIVFLVLVSGAVLVSLAAYMYTKRIEQQTFEDQFHDLADRLVEGFHTNAKLRVQVLDMLAVSITSFAIATSQVWPFVAVNHFEAQATAARSILGSKYIAVYPHVTKELRKPWEEYAQDINNLYWLNESFAYQEDFVQTHNRSSALARQTRLLMGTNNGSSTSNNATFDGIYGINPQIYRAGDPDNARDDGAWVNEDKHAPGPFYPTFQYSPANPSSVFGNINYNVIDPYYPGAYTNSMDVVQTTGMAVFGGVWNVDELGAIDANDDFDFREVPAAALQYPIFDQVVGKDKTVVAVLDLDYEFGPFFTSVLPPNANPIVCVVSNCDQVFTFEVTGETAEYLGTDDWHDPKYDDFLVSAQMTGFEQSSAGTVYNGAPVNMEYCPWELKILPTKAMEDALLTSRPLLYMAAVLGVFVFTCLTFLVYDRLVEWRQHKVMTSAVKSDQIVSSLFPERFRKALYQQENEAAHCKARGDESTALAEFSHEDGQDRMRDSSAGRSSLGRREPLAMLYPECTVFFGDIAGFTAWSSARSPVDVFTLLESIYGTFDKLARRFKVCKIETIGDCYVAVTGLPELQPNHALLMIKFARGCMTKMSLTTRELEKTLGPGTSDLALRVGLHSGPLTAGVLRGEKARFQLFGDTVNTASRMESNGLKDCIHVSQETADILISMGKGSGLQAREQKIFAKGKGELQTFWLRPDPGAESASSSSIDLSDPGLGDSDATPGLGDSDATLEVEEALRGMRASPGERRSFAKSNYRCLSWAVDVLLRELGGVSHERQQSHESEENSWENYQTTKRLGVLWNDGLMQALVMTGSGKPTAGNTLRHGMVGGRIKKQLSTFLARLGYKCRSGTFHNLDHACQVFMSTDRMIKQLSHVLASRDKELKAWVKFTALLSALIRDVNPACFGDLGSKLDVVENNASGTNTYIHSLDEAWDLLMCDCFSDLRLFLCKDPTEVRNFRQLLVNLVFAADVCSYPRQQRLPANTSGGNPVCDPPSNMQLAKTLENISVASQWTHATQHWANFKKWDERLLEEVSDDMGAITPRDWRKQGLALMDKVIIPVTKQLGSPNALGATGSELLIYATDNRRDLKAAHLAGADARDLWADEEVWV